MENVRDEWFDIFFYVKNNGSHGGILFFFRKCEISGWNTSRFGISVIRAEIFVKVFVD